MPCRDTFLRTKEQLKSKQFWKGLRCEFLGTLLYVLFGCAGSLAWNSLDPLKCRVLTILSFGLIETVVVYGLGHASGGHFNPAITIGLFVTRYITLLKAISFIIVQCLGGIAGIGILYGISPAEAKKGVGLNIISDNINEGQAFGYEFLATLLLSYTFYATLENKNDILLPNPLICGCAVSLSALFTVNVTGCSFNPARSLGPAIIHNDWSNHWLYWIAPILGGVIAAFTFEYTKDTSKHLDDFRSSLRQRVYSLHRKEEMVSCNSVVTEVNCEQDLTTEEVQM